MQRPILILIIILLSLGIFYSLFANLISDDSPVEDWFRDALWFHDVFYYLWIAKSGLILYHFGSQKKWFVFISFASLLLVGFIREFYMMSVDIGGEGGVDSFDAYLEVLKLFGVVYFLGELVYATACIIEGNRNFKLLMYYGISNAVISVIYEVTIAQDIYFDFYEVMHIIAITPSVILLIYFVKRLQPEQIKILQEVTDERDINMHSHLSTMFRDGHRPVEDGAAFLVERGYDRQRADQFAKEIMADVKNKKVTGATKDLIFGGLWCVGGIIITIASYSSASNGGGTYVIAYGAIIVGGIQFIRGLSRLF